jgi:DivIVA domain-containing protein
MDMPQSAGQQSSLDSLRTVEFRQTLRGYHIDDVDEYLERVAVEAEALQEQLRQSTERLRQAAERIAGLEQQGQNVGAPVPVSDDSLQRTLVMAQRFVDQTHAEAEAQARQLVADAEERSQTMLRQTEERTRIMTEEAERDLRVEVARLESNRSQLAADVETISRHLDDERARLRSALAEMVAWVDEHIQPAASLQGRPSDASGSPEDSRTGMPSSGPPSSGSPSPSGRPSSPATSGPPTPSRPSSPVSSTPPAPAGPGGSRTPSSDADQQTSPQAFGSNPQEPLPEGTRGAILR